MRARRALVATILGLGVAYVVYPYFTLYRLGSAIKTADSRTLEALVDWPAVREGIKEDLCDLGTEDANPGASLPPFGTSFARGIASNSIDQAVTPQALLAAASAAPIARPPQPRGANVHVHWAFFESPTSFLVSLQPPGQAKPVKLEMDLRHGEWRVQRVWLPPELLAPGSKT